MDLFVAVFHNNSSLSNVQKLFYLRKYLCEEALNVIINLPLINDSYPEALELLKKRYDNKSRLITNHINIILELPSMQKGTAASIRSFISEVQQQIYALKNLGQPTDQWDMLLISILIKKLDQYTNRAFQLDRKQDTLPMMAEFLSFLEKRATALEDSGDRAAHESFSKKVFKITNVATNSDIRENKKCRFCDKYGHLLHLCPKFKMSSEQDRIHFVNMHKLCISCLNEHKGRCRYNFKCKICKFGHNTLLHKTENPVNEPVTLLSNSSCAHTLLPTIKVKLYDIKGQEFFVRALLDSGSQVSFITKALMHKLPVSPLAQETNIIGIGKKENKFHQYVSIEIHSPVQNIQINVKCYIINSITNPLPQQYIKVSNLAIPEGILLSDDNFNVPKEISLLLGADVYFSICINGNIKLPNGPLLQNTLFGYVVGGMVFNGPEDVASVSNLAICDPEKLDDVMEQFWLSEKAPGEPGTSKKHSEELEIAEKTFKASVQLNNNTFFVDIPLVADLYSLDLGDSFSVALQRFIALERRFKHNSLYLEKYKCFITEYIDLGHAKEVDINQYDIQNGPAYFLAHHAVLNEESLTTKFRVVFDGSMRTRSGISLNDVMLNGPVVQSDLFDILLLWRSFIFTLTCDIQKMFRCIYINPQQRCLQNILWRDNPKKPIRCLQLQTVTYGLKASTFLATRCLIELADRYQDEFPLAAEVIRLSTFVDDVIAGADSVDKIYILKDQLEKLFYKGSFTLHKWCSNCTQVLESIPKEKKYFDFLDINKNNIVKTLGLKCDILNDELTFSPPMIDCDETSTKRKVLSFIGKMFDPLGLIGPVLVVAKLFMQSLWSMKLDWDAILPQDQQQDWNKFIKNLSAMGPIRIPRCVNSEIMLEAELVGYADSSMKAFGACLYLRIIKKDGTVSVNLLCSKSRVAPLNKVLTIPKLELNSALLLARLAHKAHNILKPRFPLNVFLYSDSQIVLAWLKSINIKSNPYVSNRVEKIKNFTQDFSWSYVSTENNPADMLSRGFDPHKLKFNELWWHGPKDLSSYNFKHLISENSYNLDQFVSGAGVIQPPSISENNIVLEFFEKYSNINKLKRITAYMLRFKNNCTRNKPKLFGPLVPQELYNSLEIILKCVQRKYFYKEIQSIQRRDPIKSGLANLHPFIDDKGILRVGGRLDNAKDISYEKKHPIILPKACHVTYVIIQHEHLRLLHAGAKLVLSSLCQRFWLISGLREVKKVVNKCIKCFRMKAAAAEQLMGSLPEERLTSVRPYHIAGVDFCGPFSLKVSRVRKPLITKGPDGKVRVVQIKMANGKTYVRSYKKLSILPIN
ncbi:hypothetical protein K1T71_004764 [Dendrolimus kikuchii]|uniref:Uncharacterized protein n=1 Tax=Dendrolimus kikuchii TaxID=765133 RepID=A0ACC1D8B5_9NEOP|nr:hypothetical protein K1T71_004764 [Dendrolimus kikuchii]